MTSELIPIKYNKRNYPSEIQPKIEEIPANFDRNSKIIQGEYSLHTENSLRKREFKNPIFDKLSALRKTSGNGIPCLWYDDNWSEQFFQFIVNFVGENRAPKIIEVHPPFKDYCADVDTFLQRYSIFEKMMDEKYPESIIAIENMGKRSFLISNASDIAELLQKIKRNKYKLKLMLDIPQLFTTLRRIYKNLDMEKLKDAFKKFEKNKELIRGFHVCGKSHIGNLNCLFNNNVEFKENFLKFISIYFNNGNSRYLVPEVFSGPEDFDSIITDLKKDFKFV